MAECFWYKAAFLVLFAACVSLPLGIVRGELPPDTYDTLKEEATEVLSVNVTAVTDVTGVTEGDNCTLFFIVEAAVLNVDKTTLGFAPEDNVKFEAYTRDRSTEECELFLGPSPPDLLEDGWCGLVYLRPPSAEGSDVLLPAAFGQSFDEYTTDQCEAAALAGSMSDQPGQTSDSVSFMLNWQKMFGSMCIVMIAGATLVFS